MPNPLTVLAVTVAALVVGLAAPSGETLEQQLSALSGPYSP